MTDFAATCHVYVVGRTVLPVDEPKGECRVCGQPLADHAKQTSSFIPRGKAFVIDEKELNLP